jgi:glucosyl-3-phosphoglycerate synthase
MSDLHQHGLISTLQKLNDANAALLEAELNCFAKNTPIALLLPCHGRDLRAAAFEKIISELRGAAFVKEIVLALNGVTSSDIDRGRQLLATTGHAYRIFLCDNPVLLPWWREISHSATLPSSKGFNVWLALGQLPMGGVVAMHDCDIRSYRRELLIRLCYAAAHPALQHAATKGYYSRVTERIYGRVTRLFVAPLLLAITRLAGHQPLLDFLLSFRYPLAGELALQTSIARQLPCRDGWGLEVGLLCALFRETEPHTISQGDLGINYEHKHQPATAEGLLPMCRDIAATLFEELAREGLQIDRAFLSALRPAFARAANEAVHRSEALARFNSLPFAREEEHALTLGFAETLAEPLTPPVLFPPWSRIATPPPRFAVDCFR